MASSKHRQHRRHSIASVESPLHDYRKLPRPQVLPKDDIVISNEYALNDFDNPDDETRFFRRSRGSARASRWVQEQTRRSNEEVTDLMTTMLMSFVLKQPTNSNNDNRQALSRSKRMAFPVSTSAGELKKNETKKKDKYHIIANNLKKKESKSVEDPIRQPSRLPIRTNPPKNTRHKMNECRDRGFSPPDSKTQQNAYAFRAIRHISPASGSATATDDSRRSSAMSDEGPKRGDSPASSVDSRNELTIHISGISMSSRSSEPRLKKVTFESSPYVISNSFLGDRAVLVRRGSGTAVRRLLISDGANLQASPHLFANTKVLAPHDEVSGGDWWTPCEVPTACDLLLTGDQLHSTDNRANAAIERMQTKPNIRRLVRRRSTSDKSRIIAYRNTGFLSSSQERRKGDSSRMSLSVDRPSYY
ncbi:unnamed protein product [Caenorhabditis bovis]|uniref:Uncharacterized protein n=1 Tax=Caenorhabditis bovis TaxID=2654633 RepID=A0A8S1F274_9PELO|nr:unnamed protein product [Caenorhabditis bovis]